MLLQLCRASPVCALFCCMYVEQYRSELRIQAQFAYQDALESFGISPKPKSKGYAPNDR